MSDEPESQPDHNDYRMRPGLGVIAWRSRILVYQVDGERLLWARFLGAESVEPDEELREAIRADRRNTRGP